MRDTDSAIVWRKILCFRMQLDFEDAGGLGSENPLSKMPFCAGVDLQKIPRMKKWSLLQICYEFCPCYEFAMIFPTVIDREKSRLPAVILE